MTVKSNNYQPYDEFFSPQRRKKCWLLQETFPVTCFGISLGERTIPLHKELIDHRLRSWPRAQVQYCNSVSDEAVERWDFGPDVFRCESGRCQACWMS